MKIIVSLFGEPKDDNLMNLVEEYKKRTSRYQDLEFKYFKQYDGLSKFLENFSDKNGNKNTGQKVYLLAEKGKEFDTNDFYNMYEKDLESGVKEIWFCIGPAQGWGARENLASPNFHAISLSKLTMQHDLAFLVLAEQIYRAVSIKNNLPYHK